MSACVRQWCKRCRKVTTHFYVAGGYLSWVKVCGVCKR